MANYRKIYEDFYGIKISPGMHIHHIDGNQENNDTSNLQMVTPEEHHNIHLRQGDTVALCGNFIQFASRCGENHPNFGKSLSDKTRKNISTALKNRKLSKKHRKNISKGKKGKKRKPFTEEHIRNMALVQVGKHHSKKTRIKMSKKRKGRKDSDETRRRKSEALKTYHQQLNENKSPQSQCPTI